MAQTPILELSLEQLAQWCMGRGEAPYRARQIRRWICARRIGRFEEMTDLPAALRAALDADFQLYGTRVQAVRETADTTRKLLVQLADQHSVECVLLAEATRRTVCVSTQVGCAMGCVFCASGIDGVLRNLKPYELVEQFIHARNLLAPSERLTHAVIMGMGEPLANLTNLLAALELVCGPDGLQLSQRHVTISTVGLPQRIRELADQRKGYHLAVSLHAPDDALRSQLVPTNDKIGLENILEASDYFFQQTGRQVTFEYVLLRGVNDTPEHARSLARLLGVRQVHVNLIPYNPVQGLRYETPRSETIQRFAETLRRAGLSVKVRKTKGRRIEAACGQLRLSHHSRARRVSFATGQIRFT